MSDLPRVGDLEIGQNLDFERRMQTVQYVSWAVMGLLLLAALLGLFGTGLLSKTSLGDPGGPLWMEYDHCLRSQAPQQLRIRVGPGAIRDGKARLWLNESYLERVRIRQIAPQPESVELDPAGQTFTFAAENLDEPATIMFYMVPERAGLLSGQIKLAGNEPFSFHQFVYP